jgi:hypothetical protein
MEYGTPRSEVYATLDGERAYQDTRWDPVAHQHSPEEWIVYIEDYLNEAKHILSRESYETCHEKAMHIMRKVTAMGVCCMEQNGAPKREGF